MKTSECPESPPHQRPMYRGSGHGPRAHCDSTRRRRHHSRTDRAHHLVVAENSNASERSPQLCHAKYSTKTTMIRALAAGRRAQRARKGRHRSTSKRKRTRTCRLSSGMVWDTVRRKSLPPSKLCKGREGGVGSVVQDWSEVSDTTPTATPTAPDEDQQ